MSQDPRDYTPRHLAEKILRQRSALEGERKWVTVLFVDVKDSMELAQQLDPEVWHRVLDRFFQIAAESIHGFEGTINQYTGDGIMALFGAPVAHENHAVRACHAAHRLATALRGYGEELYRTKGLTFAVRMGINTGEVVVGKIGDDLRLDYTAQGPSVGIAARVQQHAAAGEVELTADTARAVEGFFDLEPLGEVALDGVPEPVALYTLRGLGPLRTRLDVSRARGLSRFVGRADALAALDAAIERTRRGHGALVGVVGEAGVGKSRLCAEFVARCRARDVGVHEAHCPPHGPAVPLLPVYELLRSLLGVSEPGGDDEARAAIERELLAIDPGFAADVPFVLDLLGVPDPARPAPALSDEARRARLAAFASRLIHAAGRRRCTVLLVDDLHWLDPQSEQVLATMARAVPGTNALLLVNFRPEYRPDWLGGAGYEQLPLVPLAPEAAGALLDELLGTHESTRALAARVLERTGGNPFFVEETVRALVEAEVLAGRPGAYVQSGAVEDWPVPSALQPLLAERIDRLADDEKRVLQMASVLGREFLEPVLARAAEIPIEELAVSIGRLEAAGLVDLVDFFPHRRLAFRHPLTRDVAYASQLAEARARAHGAAARAIEDHGERLGEQAALIAHHWDEAGEPDDARIWRQRAALRVTNIQPQRRLRRLPRGRWS